MRQLSRGERPPSTADIAHRVSNLKMAMTIIQRAMRVQRHKGIVLSHIRDEIQELNQLAEQMIND
jgi:hypothetical protein